MKTLARKFGRRTFPFALTALLYGVFPAPFIPTISSLSDIRLPKGFSIGYFAKKVPGARSLAAGPDGIRAYFTHK